MKRGLAGLILLLVLVSRQASSEPEVQDRFQILYAVAHFYHVPRGLLYGIWKKESDLLSRGWDPSWDRASDLVRPNSACLARYGQAWCQKHWRALVSLCRQRYQRGPKRGQRICRASEVRTSYALAMGPMQHLPQELVVCQPRPDGACLWQYTSAAVDFNGDGVADPHHLADAMAMTAVQLRKYRQEFGSWGAAANRYCGGRPPTYHGYFEGRWEWRGQQRSLFYRRGVRDLWHEEWCGKIDTHCRQQDRLARR